MDARYFLWAFILASSVAIIGIPNKTTDKDLKNILELKRFEEHTYKLLPYKKFNGTITFGIMEGMQVGLCYFDVPAITFKESYWVKLNQYAKEQLFLHEIGHCVYNLEHDDSMAIFNGEDQCPVSVMNSIAFGRSECYTKYREYYINQLRRAIEEKEGL